MDELFGNKFKDKTCLTCKHRESWKVYSKFIQYCNKQLSKKTKSGFKKIKAKNEACGLYQDRRSR